ncbi:MAG: AAA family ATPase, partial [Rhodospirillales bacterium]
MDAPVSLVAEKSSLKPMLAVERLTLTHFRNYATLRLHCGAEPVVLTGPNGAGKTNLLEALSFLAPGRGLRRAKLTDIARRDLK